MKTPQQKKRIKNQMKLFPDRRAEIKREVMSLLEFSESDYFWSFIDNALNWLENNPAHKKEFIAEMKRSPLFWEIYSENYDLLDAQFVRRIKEEGYSQKGVKVLLGYYLHLHKHLCFAPQIEKEREMTEAVKR